MAELDEETKVEIPKVEIPFGDSCLEGEFVLPPHPLGVVVFAHGSGSSGLNPRSQWVAQALQQRGFGTLLFDLLTREEEVIDSVSRHLRFDIPLLAGRLVTAVRYVQSLPEARDCPLGFYGASTGGGAVLEAAAQLEEIRAIVARGGRFEKTTEAIRKVKAPVLFVVGEKDEDAIERAEKVRLLLKTKTEFAYVPEDPEAADESPTLAAVSRASEEWFATHLG